jgi:hypothetical protein
VTYSRVYGEVLLTIVTTFEGLVLANMLCYVHILQLVRHKTHNAICLQYYNIIHVQ